MRHLISALVAVGTVIAGPALADTKFFDVSSRQWVTIKPTSAARSRTIPEQFRRQLVSVETREAPGTIIIDANQRFLYLVQPDGEAIRYGIGVGREGFGWSGVEKVTRKAEWPGWTPPEEMRARQPGLPSYMPGGPDNPLGARALYLGNTLYRIHGSNEPWTIGQAVSSGCFRMTNEDVTDLYDRVRVGAKVIVVGPKESGAGQFLSSLGEGFSNGLSQVGSGVAVVGSQVGQGVSTVASGVQTGLGTLLPQ
jgi:lipoprotein-anchoring transpeptidase ErfK/SrfK